MPRPKKLAQRQLDLGPAAWFRPEATAPPANQILVRFGYALKSGLGILVGNADPGTGLARDQLTAGFSVVGGGLQRFDLVYIDSAGAVQVLAGTAVASGSNAFNGAPGFSGGPALPDQSIPVAYVQITETASVIISPSDIFPIQGFMRLDRDLDGFFVDKGTIAGPFAATTKDVSSLFGAEVHTGSTSAPFAPGVVTTGSLNIVDLLDQKKDQMKVAASVASAVGSRVYGRLTWSGGVWTLAFKATDNTGAEIAVTPATDLDAVPTSIQLVGVPKVYAVSDPARPMFGSRVTISDQAAADIVTATTTTQGKVLAAPSSPNPPQAGAVNEALNLGAPIAGGPFYQLSFPAGGGSSPGPGVLEISAAGPPGPPGPSGPTGPTGPAGPPGGGLTVQASQAHTVTVGTTSSGSGSFVFTFGGTTVKAFSVTIGLATAAGSSQNASAFWVTSISVSGNQVTVNYSFNNPNTTIPVDYVICCAASTI